MSRRTTGTLLLAISALLYAARYLSAAIFSAGLKGWSAELYQSMLQYVGKDLLIWSVIALFAGIIYLSWAEVETLREAKRTSKS